MDKKIKTIAIISAIVVVLLTIILLAVFCSEDKFQIEHLEIQLKEEMGYDEVYSLKHADVGHLSKLGLFMGVDIKSDIDDRCAVILARKNNIDKMVIMSQSGRFDVIELPSPYSFSRNEMLLALAGLGFDTSSTREGFDLVYNMNNNVLGVVGNKISSIPYMIDILPYEKGKSRFYVFDVDGFMVIYNYDIKTIIYNESLSV